MHARVAFMKSAPQGNYDAIILHAFINMGHAPEELSDTYSLESVRKALRPGSAMSEPADSLWDNSFDIAETSQINLGVAEGPPKFYNSEKESYRFEKVYDELRNRAL
ncbi:hypothetical protein FEM48_Zijuj05G0077600 [Ziziphus jujuba var. spinosa]|uniref:Uncharacterized protein n=1 Tax=Ziziphus jujuba var. spinosa TaxID=714518 RepID=A0A978VDQ0_ZIZJJ|nr:hypothetical protein FEM48_Zijuj05G0077600 [Ziziphus jujuba var. spinosa]